VNEVRQTLFPSRDSKDGPLPPLLVGLTVVTGLVDAFSFLVLGHVFVANMTGNVVFLAFALAGAPGFSVAYSLLAILAFVAGSFTAGLIHSHMSHHRGHILGYSVMLKIFLIGIAVVLAALTPKPIPPAFGYGLILSLGFSMGIQNTAVRRLAVPDLTTTVLTLTITGIASDSHITGGTGSKAGRRIISLASMFLGALIGALMILYVSFVYPLVIALIIVTTVASVTLALSRGNPAWAKTA
jgi:uncharacterized membrane protein YoaK (UPF0700 family)